MVTQDWFLAMHRVSLLLTMCCLAARGEGPLMVTNTGLKPIQPNDIVLVFCKLNNPFISLLIFNLSANFIGLG